MQLIKSKNDNSQREKAFGEEKGDLSNWPLVSIITCVYNGASYVERLLISVLNMGYPNIEHIIVNDGSTDKTEQIIFEYVKKYAECSEAHKISLRIKYFKQENAGLGSATNVGLKHITGKYWTWINCDDWYEPRAFFEPINYLEYHQNRDYVLLKNYDVDEATGEKTATKEKWNPFRRGPLRPQKLFLEFAQNPFPFFTPFLCRFDSYKRIVPSLEIYPYKYTQDVQFCHQLFPLLQGSVSRTIVWNFLRRKNSLWEKMENSDLDHDLSKVISFTTEHLETTPKTKFVIASLSHEEALVEQLKIAARAKDRNVCTSAYKEIRYLRKRFPLSYRVLLDPKVFLYLIYGFR